MNDPKRILVVFLIFVVILLGVLGVKDFFESEGYKTQVRYTTAIKIEDGEHFNHAVDTQQGNLLTNGVISTEKKHLVHFDEMTKSFTYVKRTKEHYTRHESCSTDSNGNRSCTVYYSWDAVHSDRIEAKTVTLYGREYNGNLFNFNNFLSKTKCDGMTKDRTDRSLFGGKRGCRGTYYYLDSNDRYAYYTVPQTIETTFLASSAGGGLNPVKENKITLENKTIPQVIHDIGQYKIVIFWVFTVIIFLLSCGAIWLAYYWVFEDGRWSLHD
tara:strand:- start:1918 stop:2727 length:810 start_codon:yes stop_codon:yes gene_type:complete